MKDKIESLEKKVLTVEMNQTNHFSKMDEFIQEQKVTNKNLNELLQEFAVLGQQMVEVGNFKKTIGERMERCESKAENTNSRAEAAYSLAKSHERPINRTEKFYEKIIVGAFTMMVVLGGVLYAIASKGT